MFSGMTVSTGTLQRWLALRQEGAQIQVQPIGISGYYRVVFCGGNLRLSAVVSEAQLWQAGFRLQLVGGD